MLGVIRHDVKDMPLPLATLTMGMGLVFLGRSAPRPGPTVCGMCGPRGGATAFAFP